MKKTAFVDSLEVNIHNSRQEMGENGAVQVADLLKTLLSEKDEVNMIFASSPSQDDILSALAKIEGIDWSRVNAFHMDEYNGVNSDNPASFANYLKVGFFKEVGLKGIFYMDGLNEPGEECIRYSGLLAEHPTDITLAGIGENGHIGFNDPHVANFFDPGMVIINDQLDATCRQQQIEDGWFKTIEDVPDSAVTVSVYGLLKAHYVFATVPGIRKAEIVKACLEGPISTECPATGLRIHRHAKLFLDADSSGLLSL